MAKLECISSGSIGNSYIITCGKEKLLLELGVPWNKIIKQLDYEKGFNQIVGCLLTHKHSDHIHPKTIKKAISLGLRVFSCQDAQDTYPSIEVLKLGEKTRIGGFTVQPIPVHHNVECYAYIIQHPDMGKLVFATDCSEFRYKIKDVNHWMIEANYSKDVMMSNIVNDNVYNSCSQNHMEINQTIDTLRVNHSPELQNVILIHLSNGNSNEQQFIAAVQDAIGLSNVFVATAGFSIELESSEF